MRQFGGIFLHSCYLHYRITIRKIFYFIQDKLILLILYVSDCFITNFQFGSVLIPIKAP